MDLREVIGMKYGNPGAPVIELEYDCTRKRVFLIEAEHEVAPRL